MHPPSEEEEKHASWLLVTLLAWLLPTLVIVGGLLDGLFVLHLVEGKATKGNKLMKGKQKKKGLKDAKVSSTFEVQLLLLINRIGTKVVVLFACHGLP